jgi:hypothetical protein
MQYSETKYEKTHISLSDTKSFLNENISSLSTQSNQNKEVLVSKGSILELENFISEMKVGLSDLGRKMEFLEECK